jgi:hypothetical protein
MPCSPLKFNRRFGGIFRGHLQVRRISQTRNQCKSRWQEEGSHTGFLLGILFDPDDGGDIFLQNVGRLSTDYMTLYPTK